MKAHSFFPDQTKSTLYAMAGDDCSLYFDLDKLTPKQLIDHTSNIELTGLLQVANLFMGKSYDHVAMFEQFNEKPWSNMLDFYYESFENMGIQPVNKNNMQFHPHDHFYESVIKKNSDKDFITLYLLSGSNEVIHNNKTALDISKAINSKMVFAEKAPHVGIPTPETLVFPKHQINSIQTEHFLKKHKDVMLKIMGLAGARNVTSIKSIEEARVYLAEYDENMEVIFQEKIPTEKFTEMTVDLRISDEEIRIANVRKILFAEGLWVGNLIGSSVELTKEQEEILLQVGKYAREMGYTSPEGLNCGIDYFVNKSETLITEINARWTGGLFPAEMMKRLNLGKRDVVAFFDTISIDSIQKYQEFMSEHLYPKSTAGFSNVPIGFSPFLVEIGEKNHFFIWHMIEGDLNAFQIAKREALDQHDMPTADLLSLDL
tara:strand:+ start:40 stop:1332 length:1293 start_codon:yes stop_codon:yes gene_type:complete